VGGEKHARVLAVSVIVKRDEEYKELENRVEKMKIEHREETEAKDRELGLLKWDLLGKAESESEGSNEKISAADLASSTETFVTETTFPSIKDSQGEKKSEEKIDSRPIPC
jgi:hypothetical protein